MMMQAAWSRHRRSNLVFAFYEKVMTQPKPPEYPRLDYIDSAYLSCSPDDLCSAKEPRIPGASTVTTDSNIDSTPSLSQESASSQVPEQLIRNIVRYAKYSSAAYGEFFLSLLGYRSPATFPQPSEKLFGESEYKQEKKEPKQEKKSRYESKEEFYMNANARHRAFALHTNLPLDCVLLSSFQTATTETTKNSNGSGSSFSEYFWQKIKGTAPKEEKKAHYLVHYVAVDHEAKAVVLTCRGTLGLSDALTDIASTMLTFR